MSFFTSINGTLINALAVLVGGVIGSLVGDRLPKRIHEALFGVLGLFTVLIGLLGALTTKNPLILLGSLLLGTTAGRNDEYRGWPRTSRRLATVQTGKALVRP